MTTLRTSDLALGYRQRVLSEVNLALETGRLIGLVGPNGAGKSTLLRGLCGMHRPAQGSVALGDLSICRMRPAIRARHLAYLPQFDRIEMPMAVIDSVRLGRIAHRGWFDPWTEEDRNQVVMAMERLSIRDLADRSVHELSGGESRRVGIARALAQQTPWIVLDEPIAGLDLRFQYEVMELLRHLTLDEKKGIICSLHDLTLASLFCDRIIVLGQGKVQGQGRPDQVITEAMLQDVYGIATRIHTDPTTKATSILPKDPLA
jgi:iron complex transport system ATP-binding protein